MDIYLLRASYGRKIDFEPRKRIADAIWSHDPIPCGWSDARDLTVFTRGPLQTNLIAAELRAARMNVVVVSPTA